MLRPSTRHWSVPAVVALTWFVGGCIDNVVEGREFLCEAQSDCVAGVPCVVPAGESLGICGGESPLDLDGAWEITSEPVACGGLTMTATTLNLAQQGASLVQPTALENGEVAVLYLSGHVDSDSTLRLSGHTTAHDGCDVHAVTISGVASDDSITGTIALEVTGCTRYATCETQTSFTAVR